MNKISSLKNNKLYLSIFILSLLFSFLSIDNKHNRQDYLIKQTSVIPGESVKWVKVVNLSNSTVQIPRISKNVKIFTKTEENLYVDKKRLSKLSEENSKSEESLALVELIKKQNSKGLKGIFYRTISKIDSLFATVNETGYLPEMVEIDVSSLLNGSSDYLDVGGQVSSTTVVNNVVGDTSTIPIEDIITNNRVDLFVNEENLYISTSSTTTIIDTGTQVSTTTTLETLSIEYETPFPVIAEASTETGKIVQISSTESEIPITNILAFTNIPEIYKVGQEDKIKIKWQNNDNQEVDFHAYDLNNNGKLDYVEWTVPHLSTQVFEIIFISKAFHLDENKEIITDIYDDVRYQDNNWVTINNGEYVRVTFEKILTDRNDITLYAKSSFGTPVIIEAYSEVGQLVTTFNINEEKIYRNLITELDNPSQIFELKVIGSVKIDYIVDPDDITSPEIIFTSPLDDSYFSTSSINFNVSATDTNLGSLISNLDNSLISWWRMDDINGSTLMDYVGNNNGTISGAIQSAGKFGGALDFNGTSDYVDLGNIESMNQISISMWMYPKSYASFLWGISKGVQTSAGQVYSIWGNNTSTRFYWSNGTTLDNIQGPAMPLNQWSHVAVTFNNGKVTITVNGVSVSKTSSVTYIQSKPTSNTQLGRYTTTQWGNLMIDDVMIWNRAINSNEIASLYNGTGINYTATTTGGTHTYKVYAQDLAGNISSAISTFYIDLINPSTTILTPTDNFYSSSTSIIITGTSTDNNILLSTLISVDGGDFVSTEGTASDWTYSVTGLSEGSHTFQTKVTDSAGNIGLSSVITVIVDNTKPSIIITSPLDDTHLSTSSINFNVSATDTNLGSLISNLDNSLISWWRMDDINGSTLMDYVGNNNGTISGAIQSAGKFGGALKFDGIDDHVNFDNPNNLYDQSDLTISFFVKMNGLKANNLAEVLSLTGTNITASKPIGDGFIFWKSYNGNTFYFSVMNDGSYTVPYNSATVGYNMSVDAWHMVTGTYDKSAGSISLYIDGNYINSASDPAITSFTGNKLKISRIGTTVCLDGWMDDIMIFNRILTADEITALYNGTSINYTTTLAEGTHTYKVYAQDLAGNATSSSLINFNIDTISPSNAISLSWLETSPSNSPSITASWVKSTSSDLSNQKIQFYSDDSCLVATGELIDIFSTSTQDYIFVGEDLITYTYKIISTDIAGNESISDCSLPMSIDLDNVPPITSDDYLLKDGVWQNSEQIITLIPVDNRSGIAWTKYCVDTDDACNISSGTLYVNPVTITDEGINYFRYTSIDNAGNTQTTVSRLIKIDKTDPIVDVGEDKIKTSVYTQISTTSDTVSGIASYLWSSDPDIIFSATTSSSTIIIANTNGNHIIRLTVTDNAGNSSYDEFTLTLDTTAPTISNINPVSGSRIRKGDTISFSLNESGECRMSTTNKTYDEMSSDVSCATNNSIQISCIVPELGGSGTKNLYIACKDSLDNKDIASTTENINYVVRSGGTSYPTITETKNLFEMYIDDITGITNNRIVKLVFKYSGDINAFVIANNPDFADAITVQAQTNYEYDICNGKDLCEDGDYVVYAKALTTTDSIYSVISDSIKLNAVSFIEEIVNEIVDITDSILTEEDEDILPPQNITEEIPESLTGKWDIVSPRDIVDLSYTNLPTDFINIVKKFPDLNFSLKNIDITKVDNNLSLGTILLPGLGQNIGLSNLNNIALSKFSNEQKNKIPTNIIFARTVDESIDLNIKLAVSNEGLTTQTLNTTQGQSVKFVVRPDYKAKKVNGYLLFKSDNIDRTASVIDSVSEQEFVINKFDYIDNGNGIWTAEVVSPNALGEYELKTVINYEESGRRQEELKMIVLVDPEGYIYRKIGKDEVRVSDATVSIYWFNTENQEYEIWQADKFKQKNPQITDVTGRYTFLVPTGKYYITVKADGYREYRSEEFLVEESKGVFMNIEMIKEFRISDLLDIRNILLILVSLVLVYFTIIFTVRRGKK